MENILDELEKPIILTDKEVFTKIWTSPKMVFKYIIDSQYEKHKIALIVVIGIVSAFDRAVSNSLGESSNLFTIVMGATIAGFIFGWLTLYLYSAAINWTGKWLKGEGDTNSILSAMTYGLIPYAFSIVFVFLQIVIFGKTIFKEEYALSFSSFFLEITFYSLFIIKLIFVIWSMALVVIGISEVQKFGIGKSLLNLILAVLVIVVPIAVIVFAIVKI
jgi:hypothetical protein